MKRAKGSEVVLEWNTVRRDAKLEIELFKMWEAECAVYDRMKEYQGSYIPNFIAFVELIPSNIKMRREARESVELRNFEPFVVKGLVLEYDEGGDFTYMMETFPRMCWKGMVDRAMETIQLMDFGQC